MKTKQHSDDMNNFLSGIAVVLALLAGSLSGFTAYKVFSLEQEFGALKESTATQGNTQTGPTQKGTAALSSSPALDSIAVSSTPADSAGIQSGQFVQFAFGNKAQ